MSLTQEQIAELQAKAAEADELKARLRALDSNKGEILNEKRSVQDQLKQAQDKLKEIEDKKKEEEGRLQELLDEARATIKELQKQLQDKDGEIVEIQTRAQKDKAKSDFFAEVGGAFSPRQLWKLFKESAQNRDGVSYVTVNGKEVPVKGIEGVLRKDPEYSHNFKPSGSGGGMGGRASTGGGAASAGGAGSGESNPYIKGNITERIRLQAEDPDLAAKLKQEAEAFHAPRRQG
jgi:hypothetical protein